MKPRYYFKSLGEIQVTISPVPGSTSGHAGEVSEYDLKIDSQVEKFLETKHRLVYFLVTSSAAPIIAVVQFIYGKPLTVWVDVAAGIGVVAGLLTAGSAISALWFEIASYRKHIGFRYARKRWEDLDPAQKESWDHLNRFAMRFTKAAFVLLGVEFSLFAGVAVALLFVHPSDLHHTFSLQLSFP